MANVCHLGFVMRGPAQFGPPTKSIWWSCPCAKFDWNRYSNLDDMKVFRFYEFGLKMPIHAPFWGFWVFDP